MPHPSHAPQLASDFAPDDWQLLTRLPAEVMVATIRVRDPATEDHQDPAVGQPGNQVPRRTVTEGLAGLDAIAAGRQSDSSLVRAVVAAIYAEPQDEWLEPAGGQDSAPASDVASAPAAAADRVFARCRRVVEVLRQHADPADADAYLAWVHQVAMRVSGAAHSGGVLGLGDDRIGAPEQAFLDGLGAALS